MEQKTNTESNALQLSFSSKPDSIHQCNYWSDDDRRSWPVVMMVVKFCCHVIMIYYRWRTWAAAPEWIHVWDHWERCLLDPTRSARRKCPSRSSPPAMGWRCFPRRTHRRTSCHHPPGRRPSPWRTLRHHPNSWHRQSWNQVQKVEAEFLQSKSKNMMLGPRTN